MSKIFNTTGLCVPDKHYMADISGKLRAVREMVDRGDYFSINCGRQYGKTTLLYALASLLNRDYIVLSLDFLAQLRYYYLKRAQGKVKTFQSFFWQGFMISEI